MLKPYIDRFCLISNVDKFVQDILSNQIDFEEIRSFLNEWYNPFKLNLDLDLAYAESIHTFIGSTQ